MPDRVAPEIGMPEIIRMGSLELRFLQSRHETGDSLDMFEMTLPPEGRMPVPHFHRNWDETVYGLASVIAKKSPKVLAIGKRAFYEQIEMGMVDAYAYAGAVMARNMLEDDAAEGIDAFLAKRKPAWRGL